MIARLFIVLIVVLSSGILSAMPPHPDVYNRMGETQRRDLSIRLQAQTKKGMDRPMRAFPTTGNRKIPVLVVAYSDRAMSAISTKTFYENLLNGATSSDMSMRKYYQDMSNEALNLTIDVLGPYTAPNTLAYYGANTGSGDSDAHPGELVGYAIDQAEAAGVNFAPYDNDGDGKVDIVMVIHAGRGEESSSSDNDIWSHAWDLYSAGSGNRYYDGKTISKYTIQPEYNSTAGDSTIGVFCHEFGHVLGLPDMYDTSYETYGAGRFTLMAGGSWLGATSGSRPAPLLAWEKRKLGWLTTKLPDGTTVADAGGVPDVMLASRTSAGQSRPLPLVPLLALGLAGLGGFFSWRRRDLRGIIIPLIVALFVPGSMVFLASCSDDDSGVIVLPWESSQSAVSSLSASQGVSLSSSTNTGSLASASGQSSLSGSAGSVATSGSLASSSAQAASSQSGAMASSVSGGASSASLVSSSAVSSAPLSSSSTTSVVSSSPVVSSSAVSSAPVSSQAPSSSAASSLPPGAFVETFNSWSESGSSYVGGSFTGVNSIGWSYTQARGDQTLDGKAMCLKGDLTATLPQGLASLSFKMAKPFTDTPSLTVWAGGVQIGTTYTAAGTWVIDGLSIPGPCTLVFKTAGMRTTIDTVTILPSFIISSSSSASSVSSAISSALASSSLAISSSAVSSASSAASSAFSATPLTVNAAWTAANMTSGVGEQWFSFEGSAGTSYKIYWDDSYQGSGTKTLDVKVSCYRADRSTGYFTSVDTAYTTPQTVTPSTSETIYIKVVPYTSGNTGTYAVKVTDSTPVTDSVSLDDIETSHTAIKIPLGDSQGKQYYLVENKRRVTGTWTEYLPGDGLLICHIHDGVTAAYLSSNAVNDTSSRIHGVNVIEADNNASLWGKTSQGQAADLFKSRSFTPATAPATVRYTATASPWALTTTASTVYIENISAAGATMTFTHRAE